MENTITEYKLSVSIFSTNSPLKHFSIHEHSQIFNKSTYGGLYVKYRIVCEILTKFELYLQVLEKPQNIEFHKNQFRAELFHGDGISDGRT